MSTANDIKQITEWVQETICAQLKLKRPDDDRPADKYDYQLVTPRAWSVYIPTSQKRSIEVPSIPCIIVSVTSGDDYPKQWQRSLQVVLTCIAWNPGLHGRDVYNYEGDSSYTQSKENTFIANNEGYSDVFTMIDVARREISNSEFITPELRAETENGIKFALNDASDATAKDYPYFSGSVSFTVSGSRETASKNYQSLL